MRRSTLARPALAAVFFASYLGTAAADNDRGYVGWISSSTIAPVGGAGKPTQFSGPAFWRGQNPCRHPSASTESEHTGCL